MVVLNCVIMCHDERPLNHSLTLKISPLVVTCWHFKLITFANLIFLSAQASIRTSDQCASPTWLNFVHLISNDVVVFPTRACRSEAGLTVVSVTRMRNGLKNSWCELEDFVWRRCEMLPHFLPQPRGNGPHSSLLSELQMHSRAQWNNCTKYSPAIAMATAPCASPTSPAPFRFALDPENHRVVWCLAPPAQTFGYRWEGRALSGENEVGESNVQAQQQRSKRTSEIGTDTFARRSRWALSRSRAVKLLLKLRNPRCCNASKHLKLWRGR